MEDILISRCRIPKWDRFQDYNMVIIIIWNVHAGSMGVTQRRCRGDKTECLSYGLVFPTIYSTVIIDYFTEHCLGSSEHSSKSISDAGELLVPFSVLFVIYGYTVIA